MRQPVAGVLALAEAALAEPGLPEKARTHLEQIVKQAEWLSNIIQHWLYADDSMQDAPRLLDLAGLANQAAASERVTYTGKLKVIQPTEPILICGNRMDVRRIIANLLSNATRAAGPEGTVSIEVGYNGQDEVGYNGQDMAVLLVEDSGPGFGRIREGRGLGLRTVVQSVGRCAGTIEYAHASLGGVRVCVSLPLPDGWKRRNLSHATGSV
jgi:signal transduction histidine kinase